MHDQERFILNNISDNFFIKKKYFFLCSNLSWNKIKKYLKRFFYTGFKMSRSDRNFIRVHSFLIRLQDASAEIWFFFSLGVIHCCLVPHSENDHDETVKRSMDFRLGITPINSVSSISDEKRVLGKVEWKEIKSE